MQKVLVAGLVATAVMTAMMYAGPMMGMPKMDVATMLGTMFTHNMKTAFWVGMMAHLMMGIVLFPFVYAKLLQPSSGNGAVRGIMMGVILFLLTNLVVMPMMGMIHPMVKSGMMPAPGLLMLHMGTMAPLGSLLGHLVYGALLGTLAGPKTGA